VIARAQSLNFLIRKVQELLLAISVKDNNKLIICNLANILKNNKNLVGRRLIKSILSKRIDIIVKQIENRNWLAEVSRN